MQEVWACQKRKREVAGQGVHEGEAKLERSDAQDKMIENGCGWLMWGVMGLVLQNILASQQRAVRGCW